MQLKAINPSDFLLPRLKTITYYYLFSSLRFVILKVGAIKGMVPLTTFNQTQRKGIKGIKFGVCLPLGVDLN